MGSKQYNEQFRIKMDMDPSKSWAVVNSERWVCLWWGKQLRAVSGLYGISKCYFFQFWRVSSEIHVHIHMFVWNLGMRIPCWTVVQCQPVHVDKCQISANVSLANQKMVILKDLDKRDCKHPPPYQLSNCCGTGILNLGHSPIRIDDLFIITWLYS